MTENPYLTLPRIKAALRTLELRPTRGMGQNFLIDRIALGQIVDAADLQPTDTIVEVGPGLGVLTWELVQRAGQVISVELDKRLEARLHEEFAQCSNLRIIQQDILNAPPETLVDGPYKLVANLPYAITSPVLRHFLTSERRPEIFVILVQWEVAERIAAKVGDLSVLAHSIQVYAQPTIIARVGANSFYPAPAVDSAILRLQVYPQPLDANPEGLMRTIKAGFLHARKTLSNALPSGLAAMGRPTNREQAVAALQAAHVDPQRRAETLTLAEWQQVHAALGPH
ncbi:MAG: 16S rRNA (adenine(1518)-N(6)/adenine(1519)-N(6)) -dimethyltransferase RsmA [Roseiflexaceae bacterium]